MTEKGTAAQDMKKVDEGSHPSSLLCSCPDACSYLALQLLHLLCGSLAGRIARLP